MCRPIPPSSLLPVFSYIVYEGFSTRGSGLGVRTLDLLPASDSFCKLCTLSEPQLLVLESEFKPLQKF